MRLFIIIGLTLLASSLYGGLEVQYPPTGKVRSLTLKARVVGIETTPNDGLRIVAKSEALADGWGLVINIPGGRVSKGDPQSFRYRFPVFLEPLPNEGKPLDDLLTATFGKGSPATLFKSKGYAGTAPLTPKKLAKKGGRFFVIDAGVEGPISWMITVDLDVNKQTLILAVEEASY